MTNPSYKHVVEYDEAAKRITISRSMKSGGSHLYTELSINDIDPSRRTLEVLGRMLGEALILDMQGLRDEVR